MKGPFIPRVNVNTAAKLVILFSLKTMEPLQNGIETNFQATPWFPMRAELLASSQSYRSVDADSWCKRARKQHFQEAKLALPPQCEQALSNTANCLSSPSISHTMPHCGRPESQDIERNPA